mmetsp:Transcript_16364/g.53273  ORF Transcript_16364/g.53273 Transcript_16364/m.53273 type:complete len:570 (+) Transcript_16364:2219-3928(+)
MVVKGAGSNWNVRVALVTSVVIGCADSIWNGTVLSTFVYELGHSNKFVGFVEAAIGLVQLVVAVPIGAYADSKKDGTSRKVFVTKLGCPCTATAAIATTACVYFLAFVREDHLSKELLKCGLVGVMMLWGATESVVMGPFQALFADSLPTGARSDYYSYLYGGYIFSSCTGPALSIAMFALWGNDWSAKRLAKVLIVGMALELFAAPFFLLFRESAVLGAEADEVNADQRSDDDDGTTFVISSSREAAAEEEDEDASSETTTPSSPSSPTTPPPSPVQKKKTKKKEVPKYASIFGWRMETAAFVPWTMFLSSLLAALGSGMTVKFFPLYFKNAVGLSPIQVQVVYTLVPLAMCCGMGLAQALHPRIGRVQTIFLLHTTAVGLLLSMIVLDKVGAAPWTIVLVYVVRTALANCTYPLEESILMDFVPRDTRARWKSVESIASFGWCGSALIGGVIADGFSYVTTFGATAALQLVAAVVGLSLVLVVPRKERDLRQFVDRDDDHHHHREDGSDRSMDFHSEDDAITTASSDDMNNIRISLPSVSQQAAAAARKNQAPHDDDDDLQEPLLSL